MKRFCRGSLLVLVTAVAAMASDALVMSNGSSRIVTIVDTSGGVITADDGGKRITVSKLVVSSMLYNGTSIQYRNGLVVEASTPTEVIGDESSASQSPEPLPDNPVENSNQPQPLGTPQPLQVEVIDNTPTRLGGVVEVTPTRFNEVRDSDGYSLADLQNKYDSYLGTKRKGNTMLGIGCGLLVVGFIGIGVMSSASYFDGEQVITGMMMTMIGIDAGVPITIVGAVLSGVGGGKSREYQNRLRAMKGRIGFNKSGDLYAGVTGEF